LKADRQEHGGAGASSAAISQLAEVGLGAAVAALGLIIFWQLASLDVGPSYARVGPRLFPALIATGLLLVGGGLLTEAVLRGRHRDLPELELAALLWVSGGFIALILLINWAGFAIAATALFACTARGLGSRRPLRDLAIGLTLALVCQFGFSYGLGIKLPWGALSLFG
jgi:putative tricarboxylic transport membrane protein